MSQFEKEQSETGALVDWRPNSVERGIASALRTVVGRCFSCEDRPSVVLETRYELCRFCGAEQVFGEGKPDGC